MPEMLGQIASKYAAPPAPALPASLAKHQAFRTYLNPAEEMQFQDWVKKNHIPFENDTPTSDYDMRGFWKAMATGDPNAARAANLHFPDTYKTPWHETFSNESQYAPKDAPHWVGDKLFNSAGRIVNDESKK